LRDTWVRDVDITAQVDLNRGTVATCAALAHGTRKPPPKPVKTFFGLGVTRSFGEKSKYSK
jgi:hypothetical protein